MNAEEKLSPKDKFDYAMKHFTLIADQRVKTFNFYLLAAAAAVTASVTVATRSDTPRTTLCVIGAGHLFIAVVFWLIDLRGCRILNVAADALADLERTYIDGLAERQINETRRLSRSGNWKWISYRNCFAAIFAIHALFGIFFAWHPEWLLIRTESNKAPEPTTTAVTSPAAQEPRQP